MSIPIICPKCGNTYSVPNDRAGQIGRCQCGTSIPIPVQNQPISADLGVIVSPSPSQIQAQDSYVQPPSIIIRCPKCGDPFLPDTTTCPKCVQAPSNNDAPTVPVHSPPPIYDHLQQTIQLPEALSHVADQATVNTPKSTLEKLYELELDKAEKKKLELEQEAKKKEDLESAGKGACYCGCATIFVVAVVIYLGVNMFFSDSSNIEYAAPLPQQSTTSESQPNYSAPTPLQSPTNSSRLSSDGSSEAEKYSHKVRADLDVTTSEQLCAQMPDGIQPDLSWGIDDTRVFTWTFSDGSGIKATFKASDASGGGLILYMVEITK